MIGRSLKFGGKDMATIQRFEDIDAWQKARMLTQFVYKLSYSEKFMKDFALCNQIRKSCISVMSNIAEGFERSGTREFIQFLSIAKRSVGELQCQLYIALDLGYINQGEFDNNYSLAVECGHMIGGFIKYLKSTNIKGSKFKT